MKETNCEISNIINFELPLWDPSNNLVSQNELATIDALRESNIQISGGFVNTHCKYAWISYETHLVVIDIKCGKFITSWNFPNKITSVSSFPTEPGQVPLLLIGLSNNAIRIKDSIGYLCIFDCCTSTILTTIEVPAGVEKAYVIHGGADWEEFNEKRPDTVLSENRGLIFAALRNLQHIVIDINTSLWKTFSYEGKSITAKLEFVNNSTANRISANKAKKEPTHLAYNLMNADIEQYIGFDRNDFESTPLYDEDLCSVLLSSVKIGCLITGCLGRIIIWQNDGSIGWISPTFDENAYVTHVALLEPSDDPRPFYYLWIACQSDSAESSAMLRMYVMLFKKKRCDKTGKSSLYYNLDSEPSLRFELELEKGERVHSLLSVERENLRDPSDMSSRHAEDSLLLIGTDSRLLMFDLNRWYKEQMPRTLSECRNPNSVMASYSNKSEDFAKRDIISCSYVPRSLREFPTKGPSSPEELFYPNSLTFEWIELAGDNITFWLARGVQYELLREITIAGPIVIVKPTETYRRCLNTGLMPFDSSPSDHSLEANKSQQREMLLSLCLEQRWANFLIRCASEWSDGSAAYLYPEFLRWSVQRASELKLIADRLCVPLFDQSGINIGESEVKTLRFCCQQLECLTTVVSKLPNLKSDLEKHKRALKRIAIYLQVLLWFYDVGLLPETHEVEEEEDMPQITMSMKIPYPKEKLMEIYKFKRESDENNEDNTEEILFIHQLISHDCLPIKDQWKKEAGNEYPNYRGYYPPPSLQSLLRSYLTDCHCEEYENAGDIDDDYETAEIDSKHSITIYLLMDLAMLLQGFYPNVDCLIKYPSAFKLSPSLIKLTQAFWLLDHKDYDGFFKIITDQLILISDIKDWHHKIAISTLLKNDQHKLALMYLRVLKPPLCSMEDQGTVISLAVERDLIESAFHSRPPSHYAQLLTKFFSSCKANGKLKEILHLSLDNEEEEAFVKFLKEDGCEDTRLLYFLQRCRHTETSDIFAFDSELNSNCSEVQKKVHPTALKILSAFNATLPEITKSFATSLVKSNDGYFNERNHQHQELVLLTDSGPSSGLGYPRPMSQYRNHVNEIYDIVVHKTRETCSKTERGLGIRNHIPFLGAPCSTITFCARAANANALVEQSDAICVTFAERKVSKRKRASETMHGADSSSSDGKSESKRQRLDSETGTSTLNEEADEHQQRRLSMSQVCNTPLVQRKVQPAGSKNPNNLTTETPHSILKIRQMLRRNSISPGFNYSNGSPSERKAMLYSTSSEPRPSRQIRFSMDRFRGNDDSISPINDSIQERSEQKNGNADQDECAEENYYSPNMSLKSIRDVSFLTDNSFTKYIRGLRPRPSLRRSSLFSHASSDSQSQKTNLSDTADLSALDTSIDRSRKMSNVCEKSSVSPVLYSTSVLSSNTSMEGSPMKKFSIYHQNKVNDDLTEESEEQSDDESTTNITDNPVDDKESLFERLNTESQEEREREDEVDKNNELMSNEMDTQDSRETDEDEVNSERSDLFEGREVRKNDEAEEVEVEPEPEGSLETEKDLEEGECDQDDDTFQSLSNSLDYNVNTPPELISNSLEQPDQNCESSYMNNELCHNDADQNYSETQTNFALQNKSQPFGDAGYVAYQHNTLSRPIFIDSKGIVKYDSACDITDDESIEGEFTAGTTPTIEDRESELTLNLSSSDEDIKKQKADFRKSNALSITEDDDEGNGSEKAMSFVSMSSESLRNSDMTNVALKPSEINNTYSLNLQSRLLGRKENLVDGGNQSKEASKQLECPYNKTPSARRSIKSSSASPITRANESALTSTVDREEEEEEEGASVMKRVRKMFSRAIGEPIASIQDVIANEKKDHTSEQEDHSVAKADESTIERKSKGSTDLPELAENNMISEKGKSSDGEKSPSRKSPEISLSKRTTRGSQRDTSQLSLTDDKDLSSQRVTRTATSRKTRAGLVGKQEPPGTIDEVVEKKTSRSKTTRASSVAKEVPVPTTIPAKDNTKKTDAPGEERSRRANSSRMSGLAKDSKGKVSASVRKTRVGSASLGQDDDETMPTGTRRTRASSLAQDASDGEEKAAPARRMTRASSLVKDVNAVVDQDETLSRRTTRKRGNSVPKDVTPGSESAKLQSRSRRSTSLLKEVILEESFTRSDSPAGTKRLRIPRAMDEGASSSPAANTRSRRSSIQSAPDDLDDMFASHSVEAEADNKGRARRAGSVDSSLVAVPSGKRLTRSVLAKAAIIQEVIPEEAVTGRSAGSKKQQPARRKRTTSASSDVSEIGDGEEKSKSSGKLRKGRKNSETKDFLFSLPEEAVGHLPPNPEDECRTPTYTFSEPTGLQKFGSSDVRADLFKSSTTIDSENVSLARIRRRPRTYFVSPKKR